jgi:prenyltransferase beta subunit
MRHYKLISIAFGFLLFFGIVLTLHTLNRDFQPKVMYTQDIELLPTSAESSYQIINEIFNHKANSYEDDGFFPQLYASSLQATYYGLFILNTLGKLEVANESKIISFIMSHYNSSSGIFMDDYASRYLGTDFSYTYYPLSTVLEVNSYALLSLSLLGRLDLVNIEKSVDFLWSCYNPVSSGFIGQPYNSSLEENFKISTMDNTYFAIKTLDLLMGSWSSYTNQKNGLITYINSLQNTNPLGWQYGGFYNDNTGSFDSLAILFEPNLLSSYYSIKSLEMFGMVSSINNVAFNQFLDSLYDPVFHYFRMSKLDFTNFTNIVATAIGLELSVITNYPSINQNAVLFFLYNNRNAVGLWDGSTSIQKYELIDTFQILRALKNVGEVSMLNSVDTQQIVNILFTLFSSSEIFFLIPKEYNTMDLTYAMIKSFDLFDKISELNLQALYSGIIDSYYYDDYLLYDGFISYIHEKNDNNYIGFRSYPLEFYSAGDKDYITSLGYLLSHKATYEALDSLKRMYKLDDFGLTHNLSRLLDNIVDTQFLNPSYPDQNGAFLPIMEYNPLRAEFLSKSIFLEYSFYAIKTMELLTEYLNIGDITFLNFDINELYNYILRQTVETTELVYFQPNHTDDIEIILQNTFYMIYVLKTLDLYTLNSQKIEFFIRQNIDYTNIRNIYFSYKIIKLLDLNLGLNNDDVQDLIDNLFIASSHEFYRTTAHTAIDQEIFLWICDIAKNDPLTIAAQYDENIILGTYLSISASLSNLILSDFDYNLSFQIEIAQLGVYNMDKEGENQFSLKLYIPQRAINYPTIEGKIVAYDNTQRLAETIISINTVYNQKYYKDEVNAAIVLSVLFLGVPGGFILISGKKIKRLT